MGEVMGTRATHGSTDSEEDEKPERTGPTAVGPVSYCVRYMNRSARLEALRPGRQRVGQLVWAKVSAFWSVLFRSWSMGATTRA